MSNLRTGATARIIIDCDPGVGIPGMNIDDGLALALAAGSSRAKLELATTVTGNTPAYLGYSSARTLLEDWGLDVPVAVGTAQSLAADTSYHRSRLDRPGSNPEVQAFWAQVRRPRNYVPAGPGACEAIIEAVTRNPGILNIVAIGPLTNLARAIQRCPELPGLVNSITIMGGALDVPGYPAETNFSYDPEAAAMVLGSGAPITLVPMDATTQTMLTHADLDRFEAIDSVMSRSLIPALRPWVSYSAETRGIPGCWVHDAAAVAILLHPEIATYSTAFVHVDVGGPHRGRTRRVSNGLHAISIAETVDNTALLALIHDALNNESSDADRHGDPMVLTSKVAHHIATT